MSIDRVERTGLGVAVVGHLLLFGLISIGFRERPDPTKLMRAPVEVVLTDEVGLTSAAPDPAQEEPAAKAAEIEGPVEPNTPPPEPELPPAPRLERPQPPAPAPRPAERPAPKPVERPAPKPAVRPVPKPPEKPAQKPAAKPQPKPVAKPKPAGAPPSKPQPAKPQKPTRPTGRLAGITDGLTDQPSKSTSTRPKTSQTAAQARKSIDVAIDGAIKPHWRPPTGADAELLVTVLEVSLNKDGSLAGQPRLVEQRGQTDSNAPQQKLHVERAIKAIRLAAPFSNLPAEYYDQWKTWRLEFDARLAR